MQAWEFIVVKDDAVKEQLYKASLKLPVVKDAPVDIVVCADLKKMSLKYHERGEYLYSIQDSSSAITIMMVTAEFLELGTNWIRAFDEDKVRQALQLPTDLRPVGIITVGYPLEKMETVKKPLPVENLTWLDAYKKKYPISYMFQVGPKEDAYKPIANIILDKIKKMREK